MIQTKKKNLAAQKDKVGTVHTQLAGQLSVICKGEPEDRKPGRGDKNEEDSCEADERNDRWL